MEKKNHHTFETTKWKKENPVGLIPVKPTAKGFIKCKERLAPICPMTSSRYHEDKTKNITRQFEKWNAHHSKQAFPFSKCPTNKQQKL
jgi:hypothetical protein